MGEPSPGADVAGVCSVCLTNGSYVANKCETDETSAACTDIANEIQDITTGRTPLAVHALRARG
jgi:hypothetical protein